MGYFRFKTQDGRELINIGDFERYSQETLEKNVEGYLSTGSLDELALRRSRQALDNVLLVSRVLKNISEVSLHAELFGNKLSLPFGFAPSAFHKNVHPDGEIASAKAASESGTLMIVSQGSSYSFKDVSEQGGIRGTRWIQMEFMKDRQLLLGQIRTAESCGYSGIVVTCDMAICAKRERPMRTKTSSPHSGCPPNFLPFLEKYGEEGLDDQFEGKLSWEDIDWLKANTKLPVILKGIMCPEDATEALCHGVAGVIVSNHGGRQLDSSPATVEVLASIVDAVGGKIPVMVDGGVRRGSDILKFLALGADFVFLGRPVLWGLTAGGQAGVEGVVRILAEELKTDMALTGCPSISELSTEIIFKGHHSPNGRWKKCMKKKRGGKKGFIALMAGVALGFAAGLLIPR